MASRIVPTTLIASPVRPGSNISNSNPTIAAITIRNKFSIMDTLRCSHRGGRASPVCVLRIHLDRTKAKYLAAIGQVDDVVIRDNFPTVTDLSEQDVIRPSCKLL